MLPSCLPRSSGRTFALNSAVPAVSQAWSAVGAARTGFSSASASLPPSSLPALEHFPFNARRLDFAAAPAPSPLAQEEAQLSSELGALAARLQAAGDVTSLWLRCRLGQGAVLAAAAQNGFGFHHARGDTAMLLRWLRPGVPCKVPPFASHQVGVAGLVLADDGSMLLVREKGRSREAGWKLPGGLGESGESFGDTAVREVREETGVRCSFRSVLSMRHMHGATLFGVADLYIVCLMRPEGGVPLPITIDPEEIEAACWMQADAFCAQTTHPLTRHAVLLAQHELRLEQQQQQPRPEDVSWAVRERDVYLALSQRVCKIYSSGAAPDIVVLAALNPASILR